MIIRTRLIVRYRPSPGFLHRTTRTMATSVSIEAAAERLSKHYHSAGSRTSAAEERQRARTSGSMMGGLAAPLLEQMGLSLTVDDVHATQPIRLLDSACGPGVFTREVQEVLRRTSQGRDVLARSRFVCADSSQGLVDIARKRIEEEGWVNVEARVADAMVSVDVSSPLGSLSMWVGQG